MTLSLASCVGSGEKDDGSDSSDYDSGSNNYLYEDSFDMSEDFWANADEVIYTHSTAYLRQEPDGSSDSILTLSPGAKLQRTKISTAWSFVSYTSELDNQVYEGYISNNYVTRTDITGSDFELVTGGTQTVYSLTDGLNVRKYPVAAEYSTVMGSYGKDDAITAVATNGTWFKILFDTDENTGSQLYYYVNATLVSAEPGGSPFASNPYEASFVECNPPKVMYTSTAGLYLRSAPIVATTTVVTKFTSAGIKVSVEKEGNVTDENGNTMRWSYVTAYLPPAKDGDPATTKQGYIASQYLDEKALPTIENLSLASIISLYPTFHEITPVTMYIVKNPLADNPVRLRSTPALTTGAVDSDTSNVIGSVTTKKDAPKPTEITVVATNNSDWYIIERTAENKSVSYAFITALPQYVTSDPAGAIKVTLNNLTQAYPSFHLMDQPLTITANGTANAYDIPYDDTAKVSPVYTLRKDDQAVLVARQTGTAAMWYAIEENGVVYFVPISSFASIENG